MNPFFVIFHDFDNGDPMGTAYSSKSELIADIADGQFEEIQKIFECEASDFRYVVGTGSCQDITEEIAEAVRAHLNSELRAPSYEVASWLQKTLGLEAAQAAE